MKHTKMNRWAAPAFGALLAIGGLAYLLEQGAKPLLLPEGREIVYDDFGFSAAAARSFSALGTIRAKRGESFYVVRVHVANYAKVVDYKFIPSTVHLYTMAGKNIAASPEAQSTINSWVGSDQTRTFTLVANGDHCSALLAFAGPAGLDEVRVAFGSDTLGNILGNLIGDNKNIVLHVTNEQRLSNVASRRRAELQEASWPLKGGKQGGLSPALLGEMERFVDCPPEGRFKGGKRPSPSIARMDIEKNRYLPPKHFDERITLGAMLRPGDDRDRWDRSKEIGATITGYVVFIVQNFLGEACNCEKQDEAHTDTHIDLALKPDDASNFATHVVVEITPRMKFLAKKAGKDWSTAGLRKAFFGKRVRVTGWLFYDAGHESRAQNSHPNDPQHANWRATCWEIHPVTDIRLAD